MLFRSMAMRGIEPIEIAERRVRPAGSPAAKGSPAPAGTPQAVASFDRPAGPLNSPGKAKAGLATQPQMSMAPMPFVDDVARRAVRQLMPFAETVAGLVAEGALAPGDPRVQLDPARYARDAFLTPETLVLNLADAIEAPVPIELSRLTSNPELGLALTGARDLLGAAGRLLDAEGFLSETDTGAILRSLERAALAALENPAARAFGNTALIRLAGLTDSLVRRGAVIT